MNGSVDTAGGAPIENAAEPRAEDAHADGFGRALREARRRVGLSVVDVAHALKVTQSTVDALEAERYEELPPLPYIRGYVKRYARLVGLDATTVNVGSDTRVAEPVTTILPPRSRWALLADLVRESWSMVYVSILLVFVILIGGALWWAWPGRDAEQAVIGNEAVTPDAGAGSTTAVTDNAAMSDVDTTAVSTPRVDPEQAADPIPAVAEPTPPAAIEREPTAVEPPDSAEPDSAENNSFEPAEIDPPQPAVVDAPALGAAKPPESAVADAVEPAAADPIAPEAGLRERRIVDSGPDDVAANGGDDSVVLDTITFVFAGECWVEVRDRDDILVHGDLGMGGDAVTVSGRAPFAVLVGNAAFVDISFNGEPVAVDSTVPGETARLVVGN